MNSKQNQNPNLKFAALSLRANAGDPEWEARHGAEAVDQLQEQAHNQPANVLDKLKGTLKTLQGKSAAPTIALKIKTALQSEDGMKHIAAGLRGGATGGLAGAATGFGVSVAKSELKEALNLQSEPQNAATPQSEPQNTATLLNGPQNTATPLTGPLNTVTPANTKLALTDTRRKLWAQQLASSRHAPDYPSPLNLPRPE